MFINLKPPHTIYEFAESLKDKRLKFNGKPCKIKFTYLGDGNRYVYSFNGIPFKTDHKYFKYKNFIIWQSYHDVNIIEINDKKPNKIVEKLKNFTKYVYKSLPFRSKRVFKV